MSQLHIDSSGISRTSAKSYAAGFILSLAMTGISFGVVIHGHLPRSAILAAVFCAAIVQVLVQLHYFLHLDTSSAARWNVMALVFALLIMALFVGGTIWIMYNLQYRMM